jgi:hypothetical protein
MSYSSYESYTSYESGGAGAHAPAPLGVTA